MKNWFQDPPQSPESEDAQVPYIKWLAFAYSLAHPPLYFKLSPDYFQYNANDMYIVISIMLF